MALEPDIDTVMRHARDLLARIRSSSKRIVFWGMGRRFDEIVVSLVASGQIPTPDYIVDSYRDDSEDEFVYRLLGDAGKEITIPVRSFKDFLRESPSEVLVVITAGLQDLQAKIVHEELYYHEIFHVRSIEHAVGLLSDPNDLAKSLELISSGVSKELYLRVLDNVLVGSFMDWSLLSSEPYFGNALVPSLGDGDVVFAGAFNGKHIDRMLRSNSESRIHAFEPNPDWVGYLRQKFSAYGTVRIENLLLSESSGLEFIFDPDRDNHGLAARVTDKTSESTVSLSSVSVDNWVESHKLAVSQIALDVEGAEMPVLRGAHQTINDHRPILTICLYHSIGDYLGIIPLIERIAPGAYSFEVLQHSVVSPIETVVYALPFGA